MVTGKGQKQTRIPFTWLIKKAQQQSGLTSQQAEALAEEAVEFIRARSTSDDSHEH